MVFNYDAVNIFDWIETFIVRQEGAESPSHAENYSSAWDLHVKWKWGVFYSVTNEEGMRQEKHEFWNNETKCGDTI